MRVLFLCTSNSGRSQMAEAIFNHIADEGFEAFSAGSDPGDSVSRMAVESLKKVGIDISKHKPKHYKELPYDKFDVVITLCDQMAEHCVYWPGGPMTGHWSTPSESAFNGSEDEKLVYVDAIRDRITGQIRRLISLLETNPDENELKASIAEIGQAIN